ncbi:MAG: hypothetical protein MUP36_04655 [Demequinaceae bacterium]|nr:hypothetical protein [Demequinaceae bacterium]
MTEVVAEPAEGSERSSITRSAATLAAGVSSGFIAGVLIGGVGGRIAMLILRLTSGPLVLGVESDDGFTIGRFSAETLFLLGVSAGLGILGGVFYLIVRDWLPSRARVPLMTAYFAVVGGNAIIHPGGTDFTQLAPLPLAIALFIAIPALYGLAMPWMAERFLRDGSFIRRTKYGWLVGLAPLAVVLAFGMMVLLVSAVVHGVARAVPRTVDVWRSRTVTWMGRAFLLATAAFSTFHLIESSIEIL